MNTQKSDVGKRVRITQDCRDGSPATGAYGIYEGDFPVSVLVRDGSQYAEFNYDSFLTWNAKQADPIPQLTRENAAEVKQTKRYWMPNNNPRIRLEDGSIIWGCECWWAVIDQEDPPLEVLEAGRKAEVDRLRNLAEFILKTGESSHE